MKRAVTLLGLLLALGVLLAVPAYAAPASTQQLRTLDQQILAALNQTRSTHGLRALVISHDLKNAAVAHSRAMLEQGFFAHASANGTPFATRVRGFYDSTGYDDWAAGENLIYSSERLSAETAVAAWLASPSHRKNMLDPSWREVGVAALYADAAGGTYKGAQTWVITTDFGARSGTKARSTSATKPKAKAGQRSFEAATATGEAR
ncbi:MAG: CAP domain-containing protein [Thermoleophilia bacterium]